ncbi:MAG: hypothetical protein H6747_13920 [Deltaproteobacteria bacterium]|nr:hypothetical protein [Deltaproteobacteria bacterium]
MSTGLQSHDRGRTRTLVISAVLFLLACSEPPQNGWTKVAEVPLPPRHSLLAIAEGADAIYAVYAERPPVRAYPVLQTPPKVTYVRLDQPGLTAATVTAAQTGVTDADVSPAGSAYVNGAGLGLAWLRGPQGDRGAAWLSVAQEPERGEAGWSATQHRFSLQPSEVDAGDWQVTDVAWIPGLSYPGNRSTYNCMYGIYTPTLHQCVSIGESWAVELPARKPWWYAASPSAQASYTTEGDIEVRFAGSDSAMRSMIFPHPPASPRVAGRGPFLPPASSPAEPPDQFNPSGLPFYLRVRKDKEQYNELRLPTQGDSLYSSSSPVSCRSESAPLGYCTGIDGDCFAAALPGAAYNDVCNLAWPDCTDSFIRLAAQGAAVADCLAKGSAGLALPTLAVRHADADANVPQGTTAARITSQGQRDCGAEAWRVEITLGTKKEDLDGRDRLWPDVLLDIETLTPVGRQQWPEEPKSDLGVWVSDSPAGDWDPWLLHSEAGPVILDRANGIEPWTVVQIPDASAGRRLLALRIDVNATAAYLSYLQAVLDFLEGRAPAPNDLIEPYGSDGLNTKREEGGSFSDPLSVASAAAGLMWSNKHDPACKAVGGRVPAWNQVPALHPGCHASAAFNQPSRCITPYLAAGGIWHERVDIAAYSARDSSPDGDGYVVPGAIRDMAAYDFDGDGDEELIVTLAGGKVDVYRVDDVTSKSTIIERWGHQFPKGWEVRALFRRPGGEGARPSLFAHLVADADGAGKLVEMRAPTR